ncbi:hypothetical protein NC651_032952 [Populus alba x Populus x berolinensis]|nr:hypothetical protein NC651_032952 [Populus alba x Populus x berolinensis]
MGELDNRDSVLDFAQIQASEDLGVTRNGFDKPWWISMCIL